MRKFSFFLNEDRLLYTMYPAWKIIFIDAILRGYKVKYIQLAEIP